MRLTDTQIHTIEETVASVLGDSSAEVILFGSRVDDTAKGGDIDLLIQTQMHLDNRTSMASKIAAGLQIKLGDQKIDILLVDADTQLQPIHHYAKEHGIVL